MVIRGGQYRALHPMNGRRGVLAISVVVFTLYLSGCLTYVYPYLDPDVPEARYYDENVIYTSVGSSTVVELSLTVAPPTRPVSSGWLLANLYVENLGNTAFDFAPGSVRLIEYNDQRTSSYEVERINVRGPMAPDVWAARFASLTSSQVSSVGGLQAILNGATVGEALIAHNQQLAESRAIRQAASATASSTRSSLIGRTTLRPGDSLSGGVGFAGVPTLSYQRGRRTNGGPWVHTGNEYSGTRSIAAQPAKVERFFNDSAYQQQVSLTSQVPTGSGVHMLTYGQQKVYHAYRYTILVQAGPDLHRIELAVGQTR